MRGLGAEWQVLSSWQELGVIDAAPTWLRGREWAVGREPHASFVASGLGWLVHSAFKL